MMLPDRTDCEASVRRRAQGRHLRLLPLPKERMYVAIWRYQLYPGSVAEMMG